MRKQIQKQTLKKDHNKEEKFSIKFFQSNKFENKIKLKSTNGQIIKPKVLKTEPSINTSAQITPRYRQATEVSKKQSGNFESYLIKQEVHKINMSSSLNNQLKFEKQNDQQLKFDRYSKLTDKLQSALFSIEQIKCETDRISHKNLTDRQTSSKQFSQVEEKKTKLIQIANSKMQQHQKKKSLINLNKTYTVKLKSSQNITDNTTKSNLQKHQNRDQTIALNQVFKKKPQPNLFQAMNPVDKPKMENSKNNLTEKASVRNNHKKFENTIKSNIIEKHV